MAHAAGSGLHPMTHLNASVFAEGEKQGFEPVKFNQKMSHSFMYYFCGFHFMCTGSSRRENSFELNSN